MADAEPVGLSEIAQRLGVKRATAATWHWRGLLPEARWTVSGSPAWDWQLDIAPWARRTGRLHHREEIPAPSHDEQAALKAKPTKDVGYSGDADAASLRFAQHPPGGSAPGVGEPPP